MSCKVSTCARSVWAKGMCKAHWYRERRGGSVDAERPIGRTQDELARFLRYVRFTNDCWEWSGGISTQGYARFDTPRGHYGHRWSYMYFIGAIPEGLELDHLCRNRGCVRPEHLEPVTRAVNVQRGLKPQQMREYNRRRMLASAT